MPDTRSAPPALSELPLTRPAGRPFDPPEDLTRIRAQQPLARLAFADGHCGWIATSHTLVRAILADPRFSARQELLHLPYLGPHSDQPPPPAPPGMFIAFDAPEHTHYRSLLTGKFTVRRMRRLTERIEQITAERLDVMEHEGPGLDLVRAFAQPVPALTICELLGVPTDGHESFVQYASALNDHTATPEQQATAMTAIQELLGELVLSKRAEPTDDLLSDLVNGGQGLTGEELVNIGGLLLGAGLDTTANMIALGVFALLSHPEQLDALRADPDLAGPAVEELLRYLSVVHHMFRSALEDVELDGQLIRAGETVVLSVQTANRDPEKFPGPDDLDLHRRPGGHLALGHGVHQCLGQQLARVEMQVALPALLARFPGLRLAVPPEDVPLRASDVYGVERLPVTW